MANFDMFVVMLVLYLALSAWAYSGVTLRRAEHAQEGIPAARPKHPVTYWQFVFSVTALVLGSVLMIGGFGLILRGLFGVGSWTALRLGLEFPLNDAVTGIIQLVIGMYVVYETRYTIIKHPRPPKRLRRHAA